VDRAQRETGSYCVPQGPQIRAARTEQVWIGQEQLGEQLGTFGGCELLEGGGGSTGALGHVDGQLQFDGRRAGNGLRPSQRSSPSKPKPVTSTGKWSTGPRAGTVTSSEKSRELFVDVVGVESDLIDELAERLRHGLHRTGRVFFTESDGDAPIVVEPLGRTERGRTFEPPARRGLRSVQDCGYLVQYLAWQRWRSAKLGNDSQRRWR
jgi:hypothetical protein